MSALEPLLARAPLEEIDGIPAFAPAEGRPFDEHWQSAEPDAAPPPSGKVAAAERFLGPLLRARPMRLLDAGSGDGVHAVVVERALGESGATRVALDVSIEALRTLRARADEWVAVQGDILELPFRDGVFDAAYSYGALAYTRSPARGIRELARVTRQGGLVGVWFAPPRSGLPGAALAAVRAACARGGPRVTHVIAHALVPFLGALPTASGASLRTATWRQCLEVVLVNIAPEQLVFPGRTELLGWIADAGLEIVDEDRSAPHTLWTVKR